MAWIWSPKVGLGLGFWEERLNLSLDTKIVEKFVQKRNWKIVTQRLNNFNNQKPIQKWYRLQLWKHAPFVQLWKHASLFGNYKKQPKSEHQSKQNQKHKSNRSPNSIPTTSESEIVQMWQMCLLEYPGAGFILWILFNSMTSQIYKVRTGSTLSEIVYVFYMPKIYLCKVLHCILLLFIKHKTLQQRDDLLSSSSLKFLI